MVGAVTSSEEAQLLQTIEMFEVITQSQPQDFQSLDILKEAYAKLGREPEVIRTSKRIAEVYLNLGQLSSAILEYESILQRHPDDADVLAALGELEHKSANLGAQPIAAETPESSKRKAQPAKSPAPPVSAPPAAPLEDGRKELHRIFVEGKLITEEDFESCWVEPDLSRPLKKPVDPFIQLLSLKGIITIERALRLLSDKARLGYIALDRYDIEMEIARHWPASACLRWCVLPFDRMSKSVLVATGNPYNRAAAAEIEAIAKQRVVWYLADPQFIMQALRKIYR